MARPPARPAIPPRQAAPVARSRKASHSRPSRARIADRRGLTAFGGAVFLLVVCLAGAAYDVSTGNGTGLVFALCFLAGCMLTALLVHKEDLGAAVVMPPLVYVTVAFLVAIVDPTGGSGSFLLRQAVSVVNAVVLEAPVLLAGTAAAAVLAGVRWLGSRG